jgi:hypothetical protein
MRKMLNTFGETFIAKGQNVDDFMPVLINNNTGMEPKCTLQPVHYMYTVLAPQLFQAHWAEVGQDKSWPVDPNWDLYYRLEQAKMLRIVVLTVGTIVAGYFVFVLNESLHYRSHILATGDMFYILPEYRALYAVRLFRAAEAFAKEAGADKMYVSYKTYKDISPLTKRLGFTHVEDVVVKSLE